MSLAGSARIGMDDPPALRALATRSDPDCQLEKDVER